MGELVQSADDYVIECEVIDKLENRSTRSRSFQTGILVQKIGYRYKIVLSSISFTPLTANYRDVSRANYEKNMQLFSRLAEILRQYPTHKIRIEGHTVATAWQKLAARKAEEEDLLLPLSIDRAEAVKEALIELAIPSDRMSTEGFGGTQPIVPHSDKANNWKNRRVEIYLVRQQ